MSHQVVSKMSTDISNWGIFEKEHIYLVLLARLLSGCPGVPFFFWQRPTDGSGPSVMSSIDAIITRLHSTLCLGEVCHYNSKQYRRFSVSDTN